MTESTVDRDEGFRAWLAMNEYLLDEFVGEDMPPMAADAYNETGLRQAEAEALNRFPDIDACADNPELFDKFVRFVGECFVAGLGGRWTNRPTFDDGKAFIGVAFGWTPDTLEVPTLITSAVHRRTGDEFAFVYRNMTEDKAAAGR